MGMRQDIPDWWLADPTLEHFEPAQYYSSPAGLSFGKQSTRKQQYFRNSYDEMLKDYYAKAGGALRQGQEPVSFMDFLDNDPWTARYAQLPQSSRGVTGMASNPRTRFLFNY